LKRTLMAFIILILSSSLASANVYFDIIGSYTRTDDIWDQFGGGGALGIDVTRDVSFFFRSMYSTKTLHSKADNEESYSHITGLFVVQYKLQLMNLPLFWTASLGLGASRSEASYKILEDTPEAESEISDLGPAAAFWTGMLYVWTQHLSPFLEIGYHRSFYNKDFEGKDIEGVQVFVGLRFTFFGKNRSIFEGY